jgi:hypothetical protein
MLRMTLDLESLDVESFTTDSPGTVGTTSGTTVGSFTGPCCSFADTCTGPLACVCNQQVTV